MALITCPECGHQVSDKAEACPGCGIKVRDIIAMQQAQRQQQPASQAVQRPVTQEQERPVQETSPKKQKKSPTLIIVSFVIALAICGTVYYFYNDAQQQKEQEDYAYAMTSNDPLVMQMYLTRYAEAPQEHRDSVNARMMMLSQMDDAWTNAVVSGSRSELEKYINEHPDSPHKGEAMNKIDSIDYATASRTNTVDSYKTYLKLHPDGKYAGQAQDFLDEKAATEVQPEEMAMARTVCKHFFQAINARNEAKLLETVETILDTFLNRNNASCNDVVSFMNKLYKDDITNMNWHILDDFKAEKEKNDEGSFDISVKFSAEQNIERSDASKEKYAKYLIEAEITPEGKIKGFKMKKMKVEEN